MKSISSSFRSDVTLSLRQISIVTKIDDSNAQQYAQKLTQWLKTKNIATMMETIIPELDLIIVLGGDGTLLHIAELAARHAIPVLGINLGNLGFLTEFREDETYSALEKILAGNVTIEKRLMLKTRLITPLKRSESRYALNDVVISKNVSDRLLRLSTRAGKEYITTYRADGLIFSSPTGSTAYNLSAGGPLVYPGLGTITVTPICPFMLSSRPIILPAHKNLVTTYEAEEDADRAQIIIDGQPFMEMQPGDNLEISTARHPLQIVASENRDYFSILRSKLNWGISGSR
ncbi:MAG: NAD+ kinase [Desulforhopalus sp.]|jgi:NAD+ kinase